MSISFGAVQSILTDILGMSRVSARWVPRMLTDHQKRTWLDYEDDPAILSSELLPKMRHVFTTLIQSQKCRAKNGSTLAHPPPKKFKRVHSAGKVMSSIFWYSQGVIMINYLELGCTVNSAYYAGKLRRLHQEIARKR